MRSKQERSRTPFTKLEIAVLIGILCLMILALLRAFRSGGGEPHYRLHPRATPAAVATPAAMPGVKSLASPAAAPSPDPAATKPLLR